MNELEIIKKFSKITIKSVCNRLNVNTSNLWRGTTSQQNIEDILDEIIFEINEIINMYLTLKEEKQYENDTL